VGVTRDDFADAARGVLPWDSDSPRFGRAYIQGEYGLAVLDPSGNFMATASLEPILGDSSIAVDARLVNDPTSRVIVLGCRATPENDYYALGVTPTDGQFAIVRSDSGQYTNIVNWQAAPAIRRGAANRLELHCVGTTILAMINGVIVASIQDNAYSEGRMWLGVTTRGGLPGTAEARFDNLEVVEFEYR
jgi:hypothetical protein